MGRTYAVFAGALVAGLLSAGIAQAQWKPGDKIVLKVANSQPNQSIYAIGVGHKKIIEEKLPGVRLELIATQGGDENVQLMQAGEVQLGNANSVAPYSAHHGKFQNEGKAPDRKIMGFFPAYTWEIGLMVAPDSPIKTFRDIVGKRIATGPVGSGAAATFGELQKSLDLTDASFSRVQRSAPQQGLNNLVAGSIDGVIWGTAHPAGVILEKVATNGLKFVPFDPEDVKKVAANYPYYHVGALRANTYDKQTSEVPWIGGSTHFWIHADVNAELVYAMTKALWENRQVLHETHSSQKLLDEAMVRQQANLLPFHPGAQRYFQEAGILKAKP